jgi:toxin ParE1/3/4
MKIVIRRDALVDLESIHGHISINNPTAAAAVLDTILASIEQLARFPRIGRIGRVEGTHEWVVPGLPYIIVYAIRQEQHVLDVISVFHGARER